MDPFKSIVTLVQAKDKADTADIAAREMAKHCDRRIAKARKALSLIDTFAWTAVQADNPKAMRELNRRIDVCRDTLRNL